MKKIALILVLLFIIPLSSCHKNVIKEDTYYSLLCYVNDNININTDSNKANKIIVKKDKDNLDILFDYYQEKNLNENTYYFGINLFTNTLDFNQENFIYNDNQLKLKIDYNINYIYKDKFNEINGNKAYFNNILYVPFNLPKDSEKIHINGQLKINVQTTKIGFVKDVLSNLKINEYDYEEYVVLETQVDKMFGVNVVKKTFDETDFILGYSVKEKEKCFDYQYELNKEYKENRYPISYKVILKNYDKNLYNEDQNQLGSIRYTYYDGNKIIDKLIEIKNKEFIIDVPANAQNIKISVKINLMKNTYYSNPTEGIIIIKNK